MSKNTLNEDAMAAYAALVEGSKHIGGDSIEIPANAVMGKARKEESDDSAIGNQTNVEDLREEAYKRSKEYNRYTTEELKEMRNEELKQQAIANHTALQQIDLADLPTKGMFYPEGTRIFVSAAKLADIKRWTSMDETSSDDINAKVENILESCVKLSFGGNSPIRGSWKDIIDIDRLYLLFAVHDQTFAPGTNDMLVKLDEKTNTVLKKENVKYVELSEKLMKYYNADKRCFSFPVRNTKAFAATDGKMDIYMPKLGVAMFLRDYMYACEQRKDNYDKEMIVYATMLIPDWRGLSNDVYYNLIDSTLDWSTYEWSLISKIKDIIVGATMTPVIRYLDKGGVEREAQLSFRGGFKSIFQQSLDIDL